MDTTELKRRITALLEGDVIAGPWAGNEPVVQPDGADASGTHQLGGAAAVEAIIARLSSHNFVPVGELISQMKLIRNRGDMLTVLKAIFKNHFGLFHDNKKTWSSVEINIEEAVSSLGLGKEWLEFTRSAAKAAYAKRV